MGQSPGGAPGRQAGVLPGGRTYPARGRRQNPVKFSLRRSRQGMFWSSLKANVRQRKRNLRPDSQERRRV